MCVCVSVLSSQQSKALLKVIHNGRFCLLSGLLPPLALLIFDKVVTSLDKSNFHNTKYAAMGN